MTFTEIERSYLAGQHLARIATVGPDGTPQIRPVGFRLNADGTIDTGGPNLTASRRYRNVLANPRVALVVDDMTPDEPAEVKPGWGRGVEIRGVAETVTVDDPPVNPAWFSREIIRIHPRRVISWHIDPDNPEGGSRSTARPAPLERQPTEQRPSSPAGE